MKNGAEKMCEEPYLGNLAVASCRCGRSATLHWADLLVLRLPADEHGTTILFCVLTIENDRHVGRCLCMRRLAWAWTDMSTLQVWCHGTLQACIIERVIKMHHSIDTPAGLQLQTCLLTCVHTSTPVNLRLHVNSSSTHSSRSAYHFLSASSTSRGLCT